MEKLIRGLISGETDREQAARWALQWVGADEPLEIEDAVWESLVKLSGADAPTTDRAFLYQEADFVIWLEELRRPAG